MNARRVSLRCRRMPARGAATPDSQASESTIMSTYSAIDPARQRAIIASIYSSLPHAQQKDALALIQHWPRLIHGLANAGGLEHPHPFDAPPLRAIARPHT